MEKEKLSLASTIPTTSIIFGMILMFIIVQIGFHATYIKHFPVFAKFTWLHHIHGALMASWVMLLVLQPLLIHKGKYAVHLFFGKLSYLIAPVMLISMVFVARNNYENGVLVKSSADVMAIQSITWMQIFMFGLFYSLAIFFRKRTYSHMRFMIGTSIIMIGPPISRIISSYFTEVPVIYIFLIPLCIKTGLAGALLVNDLIKRNNWKPYAIILSAFVLADWVYYARFSDAWQEVGRIIIRTFYL